MAYAVIQTGGKQFRVKEGQVVKVPSLATEIGNSVELDALAISDGTSVSIGKPLLDRKVRATVLGHGRGEKVIVYKFKRRKQYRRKQGHRQGYTAVRIEAIQ
ncbi:MAG: 50S ribosomal protein L21 [Acidobacteriota bacterium]